MYYIGIDLGGTTIKAGVVNEQGQILKKAACPTAAERGPEAVIRDMAHLAKTLMGESGLPLSEFAAIGIGIPGIQDPRTGRVPICANLFWHDVPLTDLMHEIVDLPVYVDNDATVAGVAEAAAGVGAGADSSVFITLGTGVGGGIIRGGKPWSGSHGVGSEIGHMMLQALDGIPCSCGNRGCADRYCSATALIREGAASMAEHPEGPLARRVGQDPAALTAKDVIDLAKENDPACAGIFDRYVFWLCVLLVNVINFYDPEVIVLGGGVSHAGPFLLDAIREKLPSMIFCKDMPHARIELASLGNDAGIIGAALLAK